MEVEVNPAADPEELENYLSIRFDSVERDGDALTVETDNPEKLSRVPGVESFDDGSGEGEGPGGRPPGEKQACARLETELDAARIFLATLEGFQVTVVGSEREWDLRQLRRYNPDIKHVKGEEAVEFLETELCVNGKLEEKRTVSMEFPGDEELEQVYRDYLT